MAFVRCAEDAEVRAPLGISDAEEIGQPTGTRTRSKPAILAVGAALLAVAALSAYLPRRQPAAAPVDLPRAAGGGLVQLFGDHKIQEVAAPVRSLIEEDYSWDDNAEAAGQCTIDVVQASAYLGQAVVFIYKANELCPHREDDLPCSIAISVVLTSFAWIASYLSLAADSCAQAINPAAISDRALCSADVTALVANMLELVTVGQAVAIDCDFDPEGAWASWLTHDGSISESIAETMKKNGTAEGLAEMLRSKAKQLEIPKDLPRAEAFAKKAKSTLGRRLQKAAVSDFLEKSKANLEAYYASVDAATARRYDIAQCVFDVTQAASYIVRVIFQIRSAAHNCPEPYVCTIDAMNIISSFAWITQFTSYAVADCSVESFQRGYCAGDIADMVAATTNAVAIGMSVGSDCEKAEEEAA